MIRIICAISVTAITLSCTPSMSQEHPAPGPGQELGALPIAAQIAKSRVALLAQCTGPAEPSDAEAAKLPIHVTQLGAAGPRVLVIHGGVQGGLGGGASTFAKQDVLAQKGWQLQLVARPGFDQSPSRGADDMERDSVWIGDMLGNGVHLIGHSWGGAEALLAAARRPAAVRSLILIEPALQPLLLGDERMKDDPAAQADANKFIQLLLQARTPREYSLGFANSLGSTGDGNGQILTSSR